eukprot:scaffold18.g1901.t1
MDAWLSEYEAAKAAADEVQAALQERNLKHGGGGPEASRITATARRKLGSLGSSLESLRGALEGPACAQLKSAQSSMHRWNSACRWWVRLLRMGATNLRAGAARGGGARGTENERNRRRDLVTALRSRREGMLAALKRDAAPRGARSTLLGGGGGSASTSGAAFQGRETDATAELSSQGLLQLQAETMQAQDQELEALECSVVGTKHIALQQSPARGARIPSTPVHLPASFPLRRTPSSPNKQINEEAELHNRLLEGLDEDVEGTGTRLRAAQRRLQIVMRRAGSCKTLLLMFLLVVVLVVVLALLLRH